MQVTLFRCGRVNRPFLAKGRVDHRDNRPNVGLQRHEESDQARERDRVQKDAG